MNSKTPRCDFREREGLCQFAPLNLPRVYLPGGQVLCPLHTPSDAPERAPYKNNSIKKWLEDAFGLNIRNLDGVHFPSGLEIVLPEFTGEEPLTLRDCSFGEVTLSFNSLRPSVAVQFASPAMTDRLTIVMPPGLFAARGVWFADNLTLVSFQNSEARSDFSGATFLGEVDLNTSLRGTWNFSHSTFHARLKPRDGKTGGELVAGNANISFFGATFERGATPPEALGAYRTMREAFVSASDRENHAFFHSIEMRCQRFGQPYGVSRATSALYDWLSSYGSSYVKPLNWWLGLQVTAALIYAIASPNFNLAPGIDVSIVTFTLAQTVKPFELVGLRTPSGIGEAVVGSDALGLWSLGTFFHGTLSLILFALYVLALRWRFKRD